MNLKRLRKTFGCFALSITMLMSMPQLAMAAEAPATEVMTTESAEVRGEENTDGQTDAATEAPTEAPTDPITEAPTESETNVMDTQGPETETNTGTETETNSGTETETNTIGDNIGIVDIGEGGAGGEIKDDVDVNIAPGDSSAIQEDHSDASANYTSNIIAGNGVYLENLASTYGLTFADDFEAVMDQIEADYRDWLDNPEAFTASNWQDVLAVYVLRCREEGQTSFAMDASTLEGLEKVFFQMNIRSTSSMANKLSADVDTSKEVYSLSVADYAELRNMSSAQKDILSKYTSAECKQLCAIVTASTGFVRSQVGEGVSEQRIQIVKAACSLVGKVGYFWGGKSYAIGWDSAWGSPRQVTAAGSRSSGTSRGYGLDCSGYVTWSYYNGLGGSDAGIGNHTTTQWNASAMVDSASAQPGDLVFYNSPAAGDQNHVGVVIGKNADGSMMVAHCSSSRNGVVVGEAWSQGFKYVRSPLSLS